MVNAGDEARRLGRYEVERELGRGAMGTVYLAHDPVIGRQVAIKTFRPQPFGAESEERRGHRRIIREAESAGALSHPNIVTLYDIGDAGPRGESFLAMEYAEGPTLAAWRPHGEPIAVADVAEIVAQAAAGLDYAHAMGVVHRDVNRRTFCSPGTAGEDRRLRDRQADQLRSHAGARGAGHAELHAAGGDGGRAPRLSRRHLRPGGGGVRVVDRASSLRRAQPGSGRSQRDAR